MSQPARVLIVDDSALIRRMLSEIVGSDRELTVVGTARDAYDAREKIKALNPDVLTLDVEMPKMDGVTFLSNLMRLRPMPVVMVSSLTEAGADVTLEALELGAVDFVTKPKLDLAATFADYAGEITSKLKTAAGVNVAAIVPRARRRADRDSAHAVAERHDASAVIARSARSRPFKTTDKLIAIGASTGGTEAIRAVLERLPPDAPGIVVTQHIPEAFSEPFARRLNASSQIVVCQASDGQQILPGHAYVAPGNRHLMVRRDGARFVCALSDGPPVNRHRPSVDVMFRSVAQAIGQNAVGVLLTGMGNDGAAGLKEMQEAGAPTIAQDERTSVVWGMPGEAVKLGAADAVLPLDTIAEGMLERVPS